MRRPTFIFLLLLLFISCNKEKKPVEIIRSIGFKTGFVDVFFRFMGYYYDNNQQQEYVYLSDKENLVKIFNLKGKLINTVPLKNAIRKFGGSVGSIRPYSEDTIFIFSAHRNNIAVVNSSGKITKLLHIDNILPDSLKNMYEYYTFLPYQLNENFNMLFWAFPSFFSVINKYGKENEDRSEQDIFYFSYFLEQPYLLEIKDFFSETIKTNYLLYDYYIKLYKTNEVGMIGEAFYKQIRNFLFIISRTRNKIFKVNNENYEYLQEIEINSKYTNIGFQSVSSENYLDNYEIQNDKECYKGSINNIFFNEKEKQYYVIVAHELENINEWKQLRNGDYRPFSVIIYDENFENSREYAFEANTYICRNSFMSEEGLWIQQKPEKLTKDNFGTQTFDLLKFN